MLSWIHYCDGTNPQIADKPLQGTICIKYVVLLYVVTKARYSIDFDIYVDMTGELINPIVVGVHR